MTVTNLEQIVVEETTDKEELEHWICPVCFPGYVENRKVRALCGIEVDDVPSSDEPTEGNYTNCVVCTNIKCDKCGYRYFLK